MSFSDADKAEYLDVSSDGLKVCYKGPGREEKDAASVRTDACIPTHGIGLYYYEVAILDQGDTGRIGLGLCDRNVKLEKMPGWENGSYAYHGDDGLLFRSTGVAGVPYGPKYGTDDVIGCCWDVVDNVVFFTKNGKNLGVGFRNLEGAYYPTVGMQSTGGQIFANFGSQPFIFDIEAFAQQKREHVLSCVLSRKLPRDYGMLSDTVLSYLMHNGYSRTAAAFAKDAGREQFFIGEREFMMKRQAVCDKVVSGDIDGAISDVEKQFPQVLKRYLEVRFLLHTQKFIEMIVNGSSPEETVEYGRKELSVFRNPEYVASYDNNRDSSCTVSKTDRGNGGAGAGNAGSAGSAGNSGSTVNRMNAARTRGARGVRDAHDAQGARSGQVTGGSGSGSGAAEHDDEDDDRDDEDDDGDDDDEEEEDDDDDDNGGDGDGDVVVGEVDDDDDDDVEEDEEDGDDDDGDEDDEEEEEVEEDSSNKNKTGDRIQSNLAYADILRDVYLLLAYGDPSKSPTGYLTKQNRREMVADRLNSAILASQGRPMRSVLERVIGQSRSVLSHLLSMDNGPAAMVSERDVLTF